MDLLPCSINIPESWMTSLRFDVDLSVLPVMFMCTKLGGKFLLCLVDALQINQSTALLIKLIFE